jgi:hypothetical protein
LELILQRGKVLKPLEGNGFELMIFEMDLVGCFVSENHQENKANQLSLSTMYVETHCNASLHLWSLNLQGLGVLNQQKINLTNCH